MKKYTALFMAVFMIVSIIGGGAVFFYTPVNAHEYNEYLYRSQLPVVNAGNVSTNGTILASLDSSVLIGGANEQSVYPFVSGNGSLRICSLNPGKVFIYDNNGNVSSFNTDTYQYKYNSNTNDTIYYASKTFAGYTFSIPSSGNSPYNALYDAAVVLLYQGSYKNASKLYYDQNIGLACIQINSTDVIDITDHVGNNDTYGYVVKVNSRIYVIAKNESSKPTRFKLTNSNYVNINQIYSIGDYQFIYGYYDYQDSNLAVLNFDDLQDAMKQVYFWEFNVEPPKDPDPDPNPEPPDINGGVTFVLKPGYACDIFYGGESYNVTAYRYGIRSAAFKTNGYWWPFDNVLIAHGVSSPISQNVDIYNSDDYSQINWEKAPPYSWFFRVTENAVFNGSGYDGHTIICNPVHYYGATANTGFRTPIQEQQTPIKITVSDEDSQLTVYCWSLADSIEDGVIHSTTVSRYKLGGDGMWYDANDDMTILEIGGETEVESNQQATLDDLVSNLDSFFTGTWRHIRQLATSAGKLPSAIIEMYSWLPEEYKAVLFSAFGIVAVVAILKVML